MRRLSAEEVRSRTLTTLGFWTSGVDLTSPEALAAALRRTASLRCPCSSTTLVRAVVVPLQDLVPDRAALEQAVGENLEALVAHGDLIEQPDLLGPGKEGLLLYTAPPSFVARKSGAAILIGVACDAACPLPELSAQIEHQGHVRRIGARHGVREQLLAAGLLEITEEQWLRSPPQESASDLLDRANAELSQQGRSGELAGLSILNSDTPVTYYRNRWSPCRNQSGLFVARRSQAYGADLWCYVELRDGSPQRVIDLPLRLSPHRGCDDAWRLQMAIDASRGAPQRFGVHANADGSTTLALFSPAPMWARRRWDAIGEPSVTRGALFSYRLASREIPEEIQFLREMMWLAPL